MKIYIKYIEIYKIYIKYMNNMKNNLLDNE